MTVMTCSEIRAQSMSRQLQGAWNMASLVKVALHTNCTSCST